MIRSFFSAAWIVGPPTALFVVARYGFGALFTAVAGLSLCAAAIGRWGLRPVTRPAGEATQARGLAGMGLAGVGTRLWLLLGVIFLVFVGIVIWRRRHQFFDRDPEVDNDVPVVRHNREEEIIFVWSGMIIVLLFILYQVWSA